MRGKAQYVSGATLQSRITPAYAGKRTASWYFYIQYQDHPRLCGEKYGYYTIEVSSLGSPPPMRGKAERL